MAHTAPPLNVAPLSTILDQGGVLNDTAVSTPFASHGWLKAWHDAHSAQQCAPMEAFTVAASGDDSQTRYNGLAPFAPARERSFLPGRALQLGLDDLGAPDHLDLQLPDRATARKLALKLLEEHQWERLHVSNLAQHAPRAQAMINEFLYQGCLARPTWAYPCFYIDLPDDIDLYMRLLSAKFRQNVRRRRRELHKRHTVEILETPRQERDERLRTLFQWNRQRFGQDSAFHSKQLESMLLDFCRWLDGFGRLWFRDMRCDGELAACWLGFSWERCLYFYQPGWNADYSRYGVGTIMMLEMIEQAIDNNFIKLDFLRGDETYKRYWATGLDYTWNCTVYRNTAKGTLANLLDGGMQAARPFARLAKQTLKQKLKRGDR